MPIEVDATRSAQSSPMRFLRLPEVELRVGLKRSAIYQRMSEGRFPRSRSLGARCTVRIEAEIEAWMLLQIAICPGD